LGSKGIACSRPRLLEGDRGGLEQEGKEKREKKLRTGKPAKGLENEKREGWHCRTSRIAGGKG